MPALAPGESAGWGEGRGLLADEVVASEGVVVVGVASEFEGVAAAEGGGALVLVKMMG